MDEKPDTIERQIEDYQWLREWLRREIEERERMELVQERVVIADSAVRSPTSGEWAQLSGDRWQNDDHASLLNQSEYEPRKDFNNSLDACYEAVKERVAAGGKGWEPK